MTAGRSLPAAWPTPKEHIYITGSNARNAEPRDRNHAGRTLFARHITPYAFGEYLTACGVPHDEPALLGTKTNGKIRAACAQYLQYGGLPESLLYKAKREYISGVYQKGAVGRHHHAEQHPQRLCGKKS